MPTRNARAVSSGWENLTWSALEDWCGERSLERGRDYFRSGRVSGLSISEEGGLLATVRGTHRYVTTVSLVAGPEEIGGLCTCPIGGCCKHSVAVVLAYLDAIEKKTPVSIADPVDPRWTRLQTRNDEFAGDDDWPDDEFDEEGVEDDESPPAAVSRRPIRRAAQRRATPTDRKERVRALLAGWSADRLVDYVLTVAADHPEIHEDLEEQAALQTDDVAQLIRETRKEIRKRTAEEAWQNHWDNEGHLPDYTGIERRLERLFESGQFDALLDLGQELFERGQEQVERSNDEGETATAITQCLGIIARAVPRSSRPAAEQILLCISLMEGDNYELSAPFADVIDRRWPKKVWSAVADSLLARPRPAPDEDRVGQWYGRGRQNHWIISALERAGRTAEVLPFVEAEAPLTQNYSGLVTRLIDAGRIEDARRWALEGIAATKAQWPGISEQLHGQLRRMAERAKDWPLVAAYDARPFFEHPGQESLSRMLASARKAGLEDAVRAAAMYFAETGKRPTGRNGSPPWPLPDVPDPPAREDNRRQDRPAYSEPPRKPGPSYLFLIDLAIKEKRLADALRWYDAWAADRGDRYGVAHYTEHVADAVRSEFPERALDVYRQGAERALVNTGDSAYREAARYLRKLKEVLEKLDRSAEWQAYEARLREQYKRRRNFIQVLDRMNHDRIISGRK
jgi:uncharacterized Zn finger protein